MKKKIPCCVLIMLLTFINSQAQENKPYFFKYGANYKQSFKIDSTQKAYDSAYFILLFNDSVSAFRTAGQFVADSIVGTKEYQSKPQMERVAATIKYSTDNKELVITNLSNNTIEFTTWASLNPSVSPCYTEVINPGWQITGEKDSINGILCTKAVTKLFGREWAAWFSAEHPFPFGPYKFFGLPGLIVLVEDSTKAYKFELTRFRERPTLYIPAAFEDKISVTKKECIDLYQKGRYTMSMFTGVRMEDGYYERFEKRKKELKQKENNPIELQPFEY